MRVCFKTLFFFIFATHTCPYIEGGMRTMKKIMKELVKWILITLIVGTLIWTASSLYKFIRNRVKGR